MAPSRWRGQGDGSGWRTGDGRLGRVGRRGRNGQAVAWAIPTAGKVRLTDFGPGASQAVPNYLSAPDTVSQALRALHVTSSGAAPTASRAAEAAFPLSAGLAVVGGILAGVWTVTAAALSAED